MSNTDLGRVKRNVAKMVQANAPEADIDAYIAGEGVSLAELRAFKEPKQSFMQRIQSASKEFAEADVKAKSAIGETAANVGQAVYDRPVETLGSIGASTAAGLAMSGGSPVGGAAGLLRGIGTVAATAAAGTTGQLGGRQVDIASQPLRESVGLGSTPDARTGAEAVKEAVATNVLGSFAAPIIKAGVGAANRLSGRAAAETLKSGEQVVAPLVYEKGGVKVTDAAQRVFGGDWRKLLTGAQATAKGSERLGTRELANAAAAPIKNAAAAGKLLDAQQSAINKALAPTTSDAVGLTNTTSRLASKLEKSTADLAKQNSEAVRGLFTNATKAPTGVPSEAIRAVINTQADNIIAAGGERELAALATAVGNSKDLTQAQLAGVMKELATKFANSGNTALQAVYYRDIHDSLVAGLKQSVATTQNKYAAQTVDKWDTVFKTRFALSDASKAMATAIKENDPDFVLRALSSDEALSEAQSVFKRLLPGENFAEYAKAAVFNAARKGADQEITASNLQRIIENVNPAVASKVLGKEYMQKLTDVDVILSSGAKSRSEGTLRQLATGVAQDEVNPVGEAVRAGAGQATGASLMAGSAIGRLWTPIVEKVFGQSLDSALYDSVVRSAAAGKSNIAAYAALGQTAAQLGKPAIEYKTFEQKYNQLLNEAKTRGAQEMAPNQKPRSFMDVLQNAPTPTKDEPSKGFLEILNRASTGGQGGPEGEVAPSMQQQPDDLGQFIDGLMGQDQLGRTIDAAVAQDDLDNLIRMQMMEDTKVASKVSTRQEEGFRTRMYRDTNGFRTVGIGFNMDAAGARRLWEQAGVKTGFDDVLAGNKTISKGEAESLYTTTKTNARNGASRLVKNFNQLGSHQQDALADMVFQLGQAGAMAFARTRGLIEQGKFKEAAQAMLQSRNAKQTPNRVLRRAYMLENNVSLAEADAALVKAGKISRRESVNSPQDLSRLIGGTQVASATPTPVPAKAPTKPAPKKRVRYAEAKAKRGLA